MSTLAAARRVLAGPLPALALALCAFTPAAQATLSFCNRTADVASLAYAVVPKDAPGVSTGGHRGAHVEAWFKLQPGECKQVSSIDATAHWVYFHAHGSGRVWDGGGRLCVRTRRFEEVQSFLIGNQACKGEWRAAGFRRVDPGKRNHTVSLT